MSEKNGGTGKPHNSQEEGLFATRQILAKAPVILWAIDREGIITHIEGGLLEASGQTPDMLLGKSIYEIVATRPNKEAAEWSKRALAGEDFLVTTTANGHAFEVRYAPYRHEGQIVGAVALATDVTACRMAQEEHEMLASLVTHSSDAIIGKTIEGTVVSWNAAAERLYGFSAAEAIGKNIAELIIPKEHLSEYEDIMASIRKGEARPSLVTERVRKDGRRLFVFVTVSPIKNAKGEVNGASTVAHDVTASWWLEREKEAVIFINSLFQRSEKVEDILRDVPGMLSSRFRLPVVAIELLDQEAEEMILVASHGFGAKGMVRSSRMPLSQSLCGEAMRTGESQLLSSVQLHFSVPAPITIQAGVCLCTPIMSGGMPFGAITLANRESVYVDPSLKDAMRVIAGVIGQAIRHARVEYHLRESESRLRAVIDNSSDIIFRATPTGVITHASAAISRILGFTEKEFVAKSGYDYIHHDDLAISQGVHAKLLETDETQQAVIRLRAKTGAYVPLEMSLRSIHDDTGGVREIVVVARDIRPREQQ